MNKLHTKEPWHVGDTKNGASFIYGEDGWAIAECLQTKGSREANARRIVACVNRCAGISNELLETSTDLATAFMSAENARLMQKNNELLFALKRSRATLEHENNKQTGAIRDTIWYSSCETLFDFMDSAIADAEAV